MNGIVTGAEKVATIQRVVAECYGLSLIDMCSHARPDHIAHPRQVAMWLCRELTRLSLVEIGLRFGGRDHGTVIHACKAVKNRYETAHGYSQELRVVWGKVVAVLHGAHIKSA
jgi:chromosomal replication initiator protein